jgi:hypothetical protein
MADDPRRAAVPQHITDIAARSERDGERLAQSLLTRCWPAGGDRAEPIAAAWLRRWGPARAMSMPGRTTLPACACAGGACVVCN